MENIYNNGKYLEITKTWHSEDSFWKAKQIEGIISKNSIAPRSIAEIGCGSGSILDNLTKNPDFQETSFEGYDISPQAIKIAKSLKNNRIKFYKDNLLSKENKSIFDVLLVIDVFEHVPGYINFIEKCRTKAKYKIYHIPLDIHVSAVLRNSFIKNRYTIGHIHYFTADSAINTLQDTGHKIIDFTYTNGAFGLFKQHPTFKRAIANVPRWILSKINLPFTARLLGGYSLLVLTK